MPRKQKALRGRAAELHVKRFLDARRWLVSDPPTRSRHYASGDYFGVFDLICLKASRQHGDRMRGRFVQVTTVKAGTEHRRKLEAFLDEHPWFEPEYVWLALVATGPTGPTIRFQEPFKDRGVWKWDEWDGVG